MIRFCCLVLWLLTAAYSPWRAAAAESPRATLAAFSDGLRTLEGRFEQQVFAADGSLREESRGRVALAAPRQFRWDYEAPLPQTIVADGNHIWIHDPDLEQVTVRRQSHEEQSSPLAALIDPAELDRQFEVGEGGEADGLRWVTLTPRQSEDAPFSACRIALADGELKRMEMRDSLGQLSVLSFEGWVRNGPLEPQRFRFVPPAGTDVVGEIGEGAKVYPINP